MIPQQLDQKFSNVNPFLLALKTNVAGTLGVFADAHNFPVTGRIKSAESVSEKIEMGRLKGFSEIDDLVAFTLIIPTPAVEKEVIEFCKASFDVIKIRHKSSTRKDPEIFRFDSTRLIAKSRRPPYLVGDVGPSIYEYLFEIQIRTAFEHAWSVATHDLVYKGSSIDWKRIRLAAQLKATSESLDIAVTAFETLASGIIESPWDRIGDQITISKYVLSLLDKKLIPTTLRPMSISRFSENFYNLVRSARPESTVAVAITSIDEELSKQKPLPVSVSLYQLFLGILCEAATINFTKNINCHVTPELMTIFPATRKLTQVFDYDG